MLNLICEELKQKITLLSYSDKVAGLTKTAIQRIEGMSEEGQKYLLQEQKFPIAANVVGAECWRTGMYKDLAPNSNIKSVIYFEQIGNEVVSSESRKAVNVSAKLRLVAWFNLKKIGVTGELPTEIQYELMSLLMSDLSIPVNLITSKISISVNQVIRDPSVFSKYSYEKAIIENMLLYPYSYFAIDFTVNWGLQPHCYSFTPLTAIAC